MPFRLSDRFLNCVGIDTFTMCEAQYHMLEAFKNHILQKKIVKAGDKLLLALSGGMDSMVMAHLFKGAGFDMGIAHCNFKLRGLEADRDAQLVEAFALNNKLFYKSIAFDTEDHAREQGISIQMAARNLRYDWLEEVRAQYGYDWIATAHHADDVIETFLINLVRGTGIKGLTGIPYRRDRIIRPLLFTTRRDIEAYAAAHQIKFRDDKSNAELKYKRNIIRHEIMPQLEELNPSFRKNFLETMERLGQLGEMFSETIQNHRKTLIREEQDRMVIHLQKLKSEPYGPAILFEFLSPFAVPPRMIQQLMEDACRSSGRQFFTPTHRLVIDRDTLIVHPYENHDTVEFTLADDQGILEEPIYLKWGIRKKTGDASYSNVPSTATLDADQIQFPLILRRWQQGDRFQPLGMKGQKKLSDFFTDLKLSIPEKESVWILTSRNQIIWVVGYRIDHRYRITTATRRILRLDTQE